MVLVPRSLNIVCASSHSTGVSGVEYVVNSNQVFSASVYNNQSEISPNIISSISISSVIANLLVEGLHTAATKPKE